MARKWAISDEPPLKVRLVNPAERDDNEGRTVERMPRVRTIGRCIVKVLVALWVLSVSSWLQAHGATVTGGDGPHGAIDGQSDPLSGI